MDKQFDWRETPLTDEVDVAQGCESWGLAYQEMKDHSERLERALRWLAEAHDLTPENSIKEAMEATK